MVGIRSIKHNIKSYSGECMYMDLQDAKSFMEVFIYNLHGNISIEEIRKHERTI